MSTPSAVCLPASLPACLQPRAPTVSRPVRPVKRVNPRSRPVGSFPPAAIDAGLPICANGYQNPPPQPTAQNVARASGARQQGKPLAAPLTGTRATPTPRTAHGARPPLHAHTGAHAWPARSPRTHTDARAPAHAYTRPRRPAGTPMGTHAGRHARPHAHARLTRPGAPVRGYARTPWSEVPPRNSGPILGPGLRRLRASPPSACGRRR